MPLRSPENQDVVLTRRAASEARRGGRTCTRTSGLLQAAFVLLIGMVTGCTKADDQWIRDLEHPDPFVRGVAAIGLCVQSPDKAGVALPELLQTIDRSHVGLEREAAYTLARVGPLHVRQLLNNLIVNELMSDDRRGAIKNALLAAGPPVAGPIVECMRGPGTHKVGDLGEVLLRIGAPAVPSIVSMLVEEPDVRLKNYAAFLLGQMGPAARPALPMLRSAMSSDDPELARAASDAVSRIEAGRAGVRGR